MECAEEAEDISDITGGKNVPAFYIIILFLYDQFHFGKYITSIV